MAYWCAAHGLTASSAYPTVTALRVRMDVRRRACEPAQTPWVRAQALHQRGPCPVSTRKSAETSAPELK